MTAEPVPVPPPSPGPARPTVLYILGAGRSGSTVFERLLGGFPGFVNVGELVELFRQIAVRNERCGCGELFSDCPFWVAVGKREFDGWSPELVSRFAELQRAVARQRYLPQLLAPGIASPAFRSRLDEYGDLLFRLYRAIAEESGASVVIDASKAVAPLAAMRNEPRIDVRLLHLVRDVRGVSYSWAKADVHRPHATSDDKGVMASFAVWRTAARWTRMETQAAWLGAVTKPSTTVRYEDVVSAPSEELTRSLAALGLAEAAGPPDHVHGHTARLVASHGISGNPSRFTTGDVLLRADEAWRDELGRGGRWSATTIGLPALLGHGYLTRRSAR